MLTIAGGIFLGVVLLYGTWFVASILLVLWFSKISKS